MDTVRFGTTRLLGTYPARFALAGTDPAVANRSQPPGVTDTAIWTTRARRRAAHASIPNGATTTGAER